MFRKAERKKAKLRLALYGITNSGKTYSSLQIAKGMGGRIAMIDTESGRGEIYGNDFNYDTLRIEAPYSTQKYISGIRMAEKEGYDILIIDSFSHAWSGAGGILSLVDDSGANKFGGWKHATPLHHELLETITNSKMHIIVTMRAKTEWVMEMNEKGKQAPRKVGLGFVQRDGVDYEFTVVMQISPEGNIAYVEKDNTHNYNKQMIKPSEEMGEKFMAWLNSGSSERDLFSTETIPLAITRMNECQSLPSLQECFVALKESYAKRFPDEFEKLIVEKDRRKNELMGTKPINDNSTFQDVAM